MRLELKLAYQLSIRSHQQKDGFLSFISWLSVIGIALGVAALIIILSVMNGFQKEVRDRMLNVVPHIELWPQEDASYEKIVQDLKTLDEQKHIQGIAPFVQTQAMLLHSDRMQGVIFKGIDVNLEPKVSNLLNNIIQGSSALPAKQFKLLIGKPLAEQYSLGIGSQVNIAIADGDIGPLGLMPRLKTFVVGGIFNQGHYEYDKNLILANIHDAKQFMQSEQVGIRITTNDLMQAPTLSMLWQASLPEYQFIDWSQQNKTWFAAVKTEKKMMFIILTLIVAVAAFNLVSGLVMSVKDKQAQIAIMRTFGMTKKQVIQVFMLQGICISTLGVLVGTLMGCLIAVNVGSLVAGIEWLLNVQFLPKEIYLISSMPSDLHLSDVYTIVSITLGIGLCATIYPSWRAGSIDPAHSLKQY